jgi:hypothetical protein
LQQARLKRAIELEKEILDSTSNKVHVMEERGKIDDKVGFFRLCRVSEILHVTWQTSEEDKYSAARGNPTPADSDKGKYLVPGKRQGSEPVGKVVPPLAKPPTQAANSSLSRHFFCFPCCRLFIPCVHILGELADLKSFQKVFLLGSWGHFFSVF